MTELLIPAVIILLLVLAFTVAGLAVWNHLPNGLLGSKTSATIALWASLVDGPAYWRVFDFGRGSEGEDPSEFAVGTYYVALTTETGLDPSGVALLVGYGGASKACATTAPTCEITHATDALASK